MRREAFEQRTITLKFWSTGEIWNFISNNSLQGEDKKKQEIKWSNATGQEFLLPRILLQ